MSEITPVTHTEKVVAGQVDAVTHFEKVIAKYGGGGGGGFTPTTAQLAAMNSGITSEDVEQISTNENNILLLQNGTYYEDYIHGNLINISTDRLDGYYYYNNNNQRKTGTNANLSCFILKVDKNSNYACDEARFLLYMSSKTDVISNAQNITQFNSGEAEYVAISYNNVNYPDYRVSKGSKVESGDITYQPPWMYYPKTEIRDGVLKTTFPSVTSGDLGIPKRYDLQKNYILECACDITAFGSVALCKGSTSSAYFSKVVVDSTNYSVYNGSTKIAESAHGLTISDYITITVIYFDTGNAIIKIGTSTGVFTISDISWYGFGGTTYFNAVSGSYANLQIKIKSLDYNQPISIFGDSYATTRSNERWLYYFKELGFTSYLISGFPGAGSGAEIQSFRTIMANTNPKYILWALGMNDGSDTTTYPTTWKNSIDEVIEYCDSNGIELVLATIPCVPTVNNEYKNAYVKSTGKRFIDFAKAVGAETSGSTWYTGMLSGDGVHPSEIGAKALAMQAMLDMPELMNI